ncbi:MAG TPA: hypothetical protein VMB05_02255 [Solirubrobacteraceae bacterium]|nr:hypothetical protein [Solirubrobacteraceae bacterium]
MSTTIDAARTRGGLRPEEERPHVYTGRSVEELIPQIERELGRDAIVTAQRSGLNGGVAGFFQRPFVEIEAHPGHPRIDLYDEPEASSISPARARLRSPSAPPPVPTHALDRFAAALADAEQAALGTEEPAAASSPPAEDTPQALDHTVEAQPARSPAPPSEATGEAAEVHARLLARGVERELADELVAVASAHALALTPPNASFAEAVGAVLRRRIPAPAPWSATGTSVALVGPGGAGKTSFCAALAAAYRERSSSRVACASILTGTEGEHSLLLSPSLLEPTLIEHERVGLALAQARSEGLLLLDTPGVAAASVAEVSALARLLEQLAPDHVVLALPATYGARAATQLLDAIAPLRPASIAITHARETDQLGAAVQAACASGIAPAFLLDQRRGGEGLLLTDPCDLAKRLLA